jgi:hypothetical protein
MRPCAAAAATGAVSLISPFLLRALSIADRVDRATTSRVYAAPASTSTGIRTLVFELIGGWGSNPACMRLPLWRRSSYRIVVMVIVCLSNRVSTIRFSTAVMPSVTMIIWPAARSTSEGSLTSCLEVVVVATIGMMRVLGARSDSPSLPCSCSSCMIQRTILAITSSYGTVLRGAISIRILLASGCDIMFCVLPVDIFISVGIRMRWQGLFRGWVL